MTELRCYWVASDRPRVLAQRHQGDCADESCRGCLPCTMDHCRVCGIEHTSAACGGCLTEIRDSLEAIGRMCADLPAEVQHRGVEGEAMVLLGPVADPEAWGHVTASMTAGRIPSDWRLLPEDWRTTATDDNHPLLVLGQWEMIYRDALDHPTLEMVDITSAAAYLTRHLSDAAREPWVPFEEMAKAIRHSCAHMERVLHDGEQVDRGVPCMNCSRALERVWGFGNKPDGWECKRCREFSTEDQYRFAVKADYIQQADWLTDVDMAVRTGVKSGTVRVWAQRGLIARHLDSGRVVYSVTEVETRRNGSLAS